MDCKHQTLTLYTAQAAPVREALARDGVCFSRAAYVREKYGESAPGFLTAYRWFAGRAAEIVPRPREAEFPYWAFRDLYSTESSGDSRILTLRVPAGQAVLFDLYDWNKILRLQYLGEDEARERGFRRELALRGLTEYQVMLTDFYPQWKARILASWERLFRHHRALCRGDLSGVGGVEAALWKLDAAWLDAPSGPINGKIC